MLPAQSGDHLGHAEGLIAGPPEELTRTRLLQHLRVRQIRVVTGPHEKRFDGLTPELRTRLPPDDASLLLRHEHALAHEDVEGNQASIEGHPEVRMEGVTHSHLDGTGNDIARAADPEQGVPDVAPRNVTPTEQTNGTTEAQEQATSVLGRHGNLMKCAVGPHLHGFTMNPGMRFFSRTQSASRSCVS